MLNLSHGVDVALSKLNNMLRLLRTSREMQSSFLINPCNILHPYTYIFFKCKLLSAYLFQFVLVFSLCLQLSTNRIHHAVSRRLMRCYMSPIMDNAYVKSPLHLAIAMFECMRIKSFMLSHHLASEYSPSRRFFCVLSSECSSH